ncbi:MAG: hypothetical protein J7M18_04020 [Candidatus Eremiobacteraeota bacterium]|nr:hypothetical protein [Candidatus Eremiobacteraeota bacterium]
MVIENRNRPDNLPNEWLKLQWQRWEKMLAPGDEEYLTLPFLGDREFSADGVHKLVNFISSMVFGEGTRILIRMGDGAGVPSGLFQVKDGKLVEIRGIDFDVQINFTPNSLFRLFNVSRDTKASSDMAIDVLFLLLEGMLSSPPEIQIECSRDLISMLPEEFLQTINLLINSRVQLCGREVLRKTRAFYPYIFRLHLDELSQWLGVLSPLISRREFFKKLSELIDSHVYASLGISEFEPSKLSEALRSMEVIAEESDRLKQGKHPLSSKITPPFSKSEFSSTRLLVTIHRLIPLLLAEEGTLLIYFGRKDEIIDWYPAVLIFPFRDGWPLKAHILYSATSQRVETRVEQLGLSGSRMRIFITSNEKGDISLAKILLKLTGNGTTGIGRGWGFLKNSIFLEDILDISLDEVLATRVILDDDMIIFRTSAGDIRMRYETLFSFLSRVRNMEGLPALQYLVEELIRTAHPDWNEWLDEIGNIIKFDEEMVRILFCIEDRDFILTFDAGNLMEIREETSYLAEVTDLGFKWKEACKKYGFVKLAVRPETNIHNLLKVLFIPSESGYIRWGQIRRILPRAEVYPESGWFSSGPQKSFI